MADTITDPLSPRDPLAAWTETFAGLGQAVSLTSAPIAQVLIRTADTAMITHLGLPAACQLRRSGAQIALWLGPDEWLVCRPGIAGHALLAEVTETARALRAPGEGAGTDPLSGTYLLDVTGQRTRIVLAGAHAETILAHGCAIDLNPSAFGPDSVATTLLAQTGVILYRGADASIELLVRSSFADYLAHWLVDASLEYRK